MKIFTKSAFLVLTSLVLFSGQTFAQSLFIKKVEPSNWFVGFADDDLQIILYGDKLSTKKILLSVYTGVKLKKIHKVENENYVFIDLSISKLTKPGKLQFQISDASKKEVLNYELLPRSTYKTEGVNSKDFIYLLIPDRFSNGDPSNDRFDDMADTKTDRTNPWLRHGGDLKGVQNHLDYFQELGVTALWLNPVSENNQYLTDEGGQMRSAYHGYGITDFYNVDKRLGGNKAYKELVDAAHSKGIKIIQDAVYNHVGINHWILKDLPMKTWLNQWPKYTNTNYKDQALFDPYASHIDKTTTSNGWFVPFLPDLNQKNEYVHKHLIQQALWNTETFHLDAWRIDTYFYNDLAFMNTCNAAIMKNFPRIHIFGESWVNSVANQAILTKNNINYPYKSNLLGNVDFQLYFATNAALNQKPDWNDGVQKFYQVLAQDYLYEDANKLVTFLDNHDLDRYFSVIGEDFEKYKTGIIWLMTTRGIPQMYYGTEILMKNFKNPSDAEVRKDFPGGWAEDSINKFKSTGRDPKENEAFEFVKKLANYRKQSKAITEGKLVQYLPYNDGIYVYFRIAGEQKVMVVSNTSETKKTVDLNKFSDQLKSSNSLFEIFTQKSFNSNQSIDLNSKQSIVLEVK